MFAIQRCWECGSLATHGSQTEPYTCDMHHTAQQQYAPIPRRSVSLTIDEALALYAADVARQQADQDWLLDIGVEPFEVDASRVSELLEAVAHGYTHVTILL